MEKSKIMEGKTMTPALAKAISSLVFRGQVSPGKPAGTS